jgi:outer membrane protein TolC
VAETELEGLQRAAVIEVTAAYRRFESARQALALFEEVAPKLDENATLVVRAYRAGETDLATLLVEQDRIFRAKLAYLDALLEYESALTALERAVGEPILKP